MKQKIEIEIDIPNGYEFVRYGIPNEDEYELFFLIGSVVFKIGFEINNEILIIRKIKQWRDPVLPADWGKEARFGDGAKLWHESTLLGWTKTEGTDYFNWLDVNMTGWQFCQVCDEEKK